MNFKNNHCFNENKNLRCSSQGHANILAKYRQVNHTFARRSLQHVESSYENSLIKRCSKTVINIL